MDLLKVLRKMQLQVEVVMVTIMEKKAKLFFHQES